VGIAHARHVPARLGQPRALTIFFIVVGLEIKREFTVGHLATLRSGALPVIASLGGIVLPALIYAFIAPPR
jgi:NhaA family Na+:H+ antiporter